MTPEKTLAIVELSAALAAGTYALAFAPRTNAYPLLVVGALGAIGVASYRAGRAFGVTLDVRASVAPATASTEVRADA